MNRHLQFLLAMTVGAFALSAAADGVREDELTIFTDAAREEVVQDIDLRGRWPVAKLDNEPALKGLTYSAVGWERDPAEDATRTVTITARAGTLADGVFMPDGSAEMTVLSATTGSGTFDWQVSDISKKLYQLTHAVRKSGVVDATAYLYGYLDFTHCAIWASQADVEAAVLGSITHKIAVKQDGDLPWQPVDTASVRSGIATGTALPAGTETATTFVFKGHGVFHYTYSLTGGELKVVSGGEVVSTFSETAAWTACTLTFTDYGEHEVIFVYTSGGLGGSAALKNVSWEETEVVDLAFVESGSVRTDLQTGVRTPKSLTDVLPFVYSPTNWIGTVAGTASRVSVVQLAGTDPDVTKWTEEVPGTFKVLKESADEGEVVWRAKQGVWKATFDILDGTGSVYQETALFDLRNASASGLVISLR